MQDLANGHLDVKALGEAANGDENTIVTTRTGNTYPSAERAINIMFQNGGLPAVPFATKALMTASALVDGDYAMVTDDTVNNGLYVKTAGSWVKSSYDPLTQAKTYTDAAKTEAITTAATDAELLVSNVETSIVMYKKIEGRVDLQLDSEGGYRVIRSSASGDFKYFGTFNGSAKPLIAGGGVTINETESDITISASDSLLPTPHEYVLCLIAGQSNATSYGGDADKAPNIPSGVCMAWDNSAKVLHDINDGSVTAINCKKTYGAALALEFYKRTGKGLIIVNAAVGSTAQHVSADNGSGNWDTAGLLRGKATTYYNDCSTYLAANSINYQNGFICWTQGERDGQEIQAGTITEAQYKAALEAMIDYFKINMGTKIPFILSTTAYYANTGDNAGAKAVRSAQRSVCHTKQGAWLGFSGATGFFTRGLVPDGVHYNQEARNTLGYYMAIAASTLSAGVH